MTVADQIDQIRGQFPHPIDQHIGSAAEFTFAVRYDGHYNWIRSIGAASKPCPSLAYDRIGTNLYNFASNQSYGACIDVDGASHDDLTEDQLQEIIDRLPDYCLCVRSTSGTGLHIFILWDNPTPATPHEHRQLGRRAAHKLTQDVNLPFEWIDVSSNILWTVAKDAGPGAFTLIKAPARKLPVDELPELPTMPGKVGDAPATLSEPDKEFMEKAKAHQFACEWVTDIGAIRCHKGLLIALQCQYPGSFHTTCPCTDPETPNCWLRRNGDHWNVYSWGEREHASWSKSPSGWLTTTFAKIPDFDATNTGTPESDNVYRYDDPTEAASIFRQLTGQTITVDQTPGRQFDIAKKGDVIQLRMHKLRTDEPCPDGWHKGKGYFWTGHKPEGPSPKDVKSLKQQFWQTYQDKKLGPLFRITDGRPVQHSRDQAYAVARSQLGPTGPKIIDEITANPVELVSEAFRPVLQPGKLNVGPQLRVTPQPGRLDHWFKMLLRLGDQLTPALIDPEAPWAEWVREHRCTSGGRYLLWWCAWLLQEPTQRLPALAFVGGKDVGKSTLGDALETLWDADGTSDAGELLRTKSQFTGNVAQSVLGRIEDMDISGREKLNRLTPWVTSPTLMCEHKGRMPYAVPNQLHLLMTCNDQSFVPIHDKDCRFVLIEVGDLLDKDLEFFTKLRSEAPAFLHHVLNIKLPPRYSRLALPDVMTAAKEDVAETNKTIVERFADECLKPVQNGFVSNSDLYATYQKWCSANHRGPSCDDSASLIRELSGWFANRNIGTRKKNGERGREGITCI